MTTSTAPGPVGAMPGIAGLAVRPLDPTLDRDRLRSICPRLSLQSRYQRFFSGIRGLSTPLLEQLLDIDHDRREALLALDGNDDLVAVARYSASATQPHDADLAVLVADAWQRQGVATHMLTILAGLAVERGICTFTAATLLDNQQARSLLRSFWPDVRARYAASCYNYRLPLAACQRPPANVPTTAHTHRG